MTIPQWIATLATLLAAVATLVTLAKFVWSGGDGFSELRSAVKTLTEEVTMLRKTRDEHIQVVPRILVTLDGLERRMTAAEGKIDRLGGAR